MNFGGWLLTITAAQRAASLQRLMEASQLTEPYVLFTDPPDDNNKLRRHRNKRYRFEPIEGAGEI
jgi:hypothetical protein